MAGGEKLAERIHCERQMKREREKKYLRGNGGKKKGKE